MCRTCISKDRSRLCSKQLFNMKHADMFPAPLIYMRGIASAVRVSVKGNIAAHAELGE